MQNYPLACSNLVRALNFNKLLDCFALEMVMKAGQIVFMMFYK